MLENVDLSKKMKKKDYDLIKEEYEVKLGSLQREAKKLGIPIIILFEGWGASGNQCNGPEYHAYPLFTASGSEHSIGSVFKGNGKGIKNRNSDLQFHCHSLLPECQSVSGLQPF